MSDHVTFLRNEQTIAEREEMPKTAKRFGKAADEIERLRDLNQCVSCPTDQPGRPYNAILCRECAGSLTDEIERLQPVHDAIVELEREVAQQKTEYVIEKLDVSDKTFMIWQARYILGLQAKIRRLRKALETIVAHQVAIGGRYAALSTTRRIAQDALDYQATTQQKEVPGDSP